MIREKENTRFYIEGNKGADYVSIEKIDNNRLRLEVGVCCARTIDVIFTAEVLSSFLTTLTEEENKTLLDIAASKLQWDDKINKQYLKGCKTL